MICGIQGCDQGATVVCATPDQRLVEVCSDCADQSGWEFVKVLASR